MSLPVDDHDAIDFGKDSVGELFRRMFLPTMVSMVSMVVLNMTDGAFVGHGVGSDALAAVNIIAPIFMITGGMGLMFGIGGSVVASIHLGRGRVRAASVNVTQSLIGGFAAGLVLSVLMLAFPQETCRLFGASERLLPLAQSYLFWLALLMPLCVVCSAGMFMVRLDGAPRLAMWLNIVCAVLNIFGDWLLIFPFGMGVAGAALATSFSWAVCGLGTLVYLAFFSRTLRLQKLSPTRLGFLLTFRNLGYQLRIGASAFVGELAIALIMVVGNYQFMRYLGEDGVAAFSVGCYLMPIAFMVGNAIVQSVQPIISYAYGRRNQLRIRETMRVTFVAALACGVFGVAFVAFGADLISTLFLASGCAAKRLAGEGLPLFGVGFPFVILNLALIGYYQSVERSAPAMVFTLLRGVLFMVPAFILMPRFFGVAGLWLAVAVSEAATLFLNFASYARSSGQSARDIDTGGKTDAKRI